MSFSRNPQVVQVRDQIAAAIRRLGLSSKQIAVSADTTERAVENWRAASSAPSAAALAALCRENDQFWRDFCAMVDRPVDAEAAARFIDDFNEWRKIRSQNGPL